MKKHQFLILFFLGFNFISIAQENETDRKGTFIFSIGPEYRVTPFYKVPGITFVSDFNYTGYTNVDKQNSGPAVNLGVEYFVTKNLSVGFTNSFRYDLVISEFTEINGPVGVKNADYKIILDYNFFLRYYVKAFANSELYIDVGYAFMNRNTDFAVKSTTYNDDGTIFAEGYTITDYHYTGNRVSIGYKKGKSKIFLGLYTTTQSNYFEQTTSFSVPFIGCSFDIGKL